MKSKTLKSYLTNIFGINKNSTKYLLYTCGINKRIDSQKVKVSQYYQIDKKINKIKKGKHLKEDIRNTISFLLKIKTYRGIRHNLGYPVRGQRTHTNAKTNKKTKKKISNKS